MPLEPAPKRTVVFVDGQNLFHSARRAFGYTQPNYDIYALATAMVAGQPDWDLSEIRFYTGIHTPAGDAALNAYWSAKLSVMGRQGIKVYSRPLRYRNRQVTLTDGTTHAYLTAVEKGVDVRIALDVIRMASRNLYDVALIFSQDQDFSEVAKEIRAIASEQNRWIKIASAFPMSPTVTNRKGIEHTDWIPIDRVTYDACLDSRTYASSKTP